MIKLAVFACGRRRSEKIGFKHNRVCIATREREWDCFDVFFWLSRRKEGRKEINAGEGYNHDKTQVVTDTCPSVQS